MGRTRDTGGLVGRGAVRRDARVITREGKAGSLACRQPPRPGGPRRPRCASSGRRGSGLDAPPRARAFCESARPGIGGGRLRTLPEESGLSGGDARRRRQAQVRVGLGAGEAAARGALDEALLHQERLDHVLDGVARLGDGVGEGLDAGRAAAVVVDQGRQIAAVEGVEAERIDVEAGEGAGGDRPIDERRGVGGGEVAHTAQQAAGDPGRAAGARGDFGGAIGGEGEAHLAGGLGEHGRQLGLGVEVEAQGNAEAVAQGIGEQAGSGGGGDEGEGGQIDADRPRARSGADHQIEGVILHRRIEDLLDVGGEAMDLVDEQDIARLEVGQDGGEIAGLGQHRPGGGAEADAELAGDDLGEGRLAEAGRAEQQDMVERLAAGAGGVDVDAQIGLGLLLADEFGERLGTQRAVGGVGRGARGVGRLWRDETVGGLAHWPRSLIARDFSGRRAPGRTDRRPCRGWRGRRRRRGAPASRKSRAG